MANPIEDEPSFLEHRMTLCVKSATAAVVSVVLLFLFGGANLSSAADLQQTIAKYRLAQQEFVKGNPQPFKDICSHADDVTILGGFGGFEKGWSAQVENPRPLRAFPALVRAQARPAGGG